MFLRKPLCSNLLFSQICFPCQEKRLFVLYYLIEKQYPKSLLAGRYCSNICVVKRVKDAVLQPSVMLDFKENFRLFLSVANIDKQFSFGKRLFNRIVCVLLWNRDH